MDLHLRLFSTALRRDNMTKYFCDESVIFMMDVEITRSENVSWTELAEASIQSHVCLMAHVSEVINEFLGECTQTIF